jgi:hypothetical protein
VASQVSTAVTGGRHVVAAAVVNPAAGSSSATSRQSLLRGPDLLPDQGQGSSPPSGALQCKSCGLLGQASAWRSAVHCSCMS